MRKALASREEQRSRFVGTVERVGTKRERPASHGRWQGREETTLLLRDVCDAATGRAVCDPIGFGLNCRFRRAPWRSPTTT